MDTQRTSSGLGEEVRIAIVTIVNPLAVLATTTLFDLSRRRIILSPGSFPHSASVLPNALLTAT